MLIKNLFERDIFRPINGVVKADQLDDSSVWQELDEFVVTRELDQHLRKFIAWYLEALDQGKNTEASGKMGVWISGFFGSGKSHFLKVLSYLLGNGTHTLNGRQKRAVEFFESKVKDAMLFGDIKRAVAANTDVILFNIDSKADHGGGSGRDLILRVFLKVVNELQGYSGDHPHIAQMERYLESKGKLKAFHAAYQKHTGLDWVNERDAYHFNRDEVVKAFSEALGQSQAAAEKWIDGADENFSMSVENFCKRVKEHLDSKGPRQRIVFLVDEVGQFIGADSHLMLSLQTITEELGTFCRRRAWVVVTSQEDIDTVLGDMSKTKKQDFSKIQGRFFPPLSLSSANVDEVIQSRLLAKRSDVRSDLEALFKKRGDILKSQLTFKNCGMTFRQFKDGDDFVKNYPFAPYQFQLIQKVFEAIRKAGATGMHLARGERSMLDAFQSAAKAVAIDEVGVLVPLYDFYPSIESFLDTAVKKTIDQAETNPSLEPFDIHLLQVLFLIRYVDEMKGNVDNLVTLCLDQIDGDRLALRRRIEQSLRRLEKETLISRSGENYFFLTNEERDIAKEIKNVDLDNGAEARLQGEIVFDDVLKGQRKHRFAANRMDFDFNRRCDGFPIGNQKDAALVVSVITPLADDYEAYDKSKAILECAADGGYVLIRLGNDEGLGRELRTYLQTEKYLSRKNDGTLPDSTKRILRDCAEDNRQRRERLTALLGEMLAAAEYFVAGQALKLKASTPMAALGEAMEYLIQNTFSKMGFLKRLTAEPLKEVQAVLRSNDIAKEQLLFQTGENNPEALEDLRSYLQLCAMKSQQVVLHDVLEKRYALRPYGWPDEEVLLLLARLIVLSEINLMLDSTLLPIDKVYEAITAPEREFLNVIPFVMLDGVTTIRLHEFGALAVKIRLERDEPDGKFLLYAPSEEPDYENDWLLDIRLYSRSFRADRASILLQELGLVNQSLRTHVAERRKFFDAKERLQKIKGLVAPDDAAGDLDRKMIAVVAKADQPELFNLVRTIFHAWIESGIELYLDNPPAVWGQIEKFDLDVPFWQMAKATFGYEEESPSLKNFLLRLLLTDYAHHLKCDVPQAVRGLLLPKTGWANTVVCLAQWRDSGSKAASYDRLSAEAAPILKIDDHLPKLEIEQLVDVMTFLAVEKWIASGLREWVQATAETINADDVRAVATRRQSGHWASLNVADTAEAPRQALHAVYDALVAAAEFYALRNQHTGGFDYPGAAAMYRAYETELYCFDQLYRHFCESADTAEKQGWNFVKPLRADIEAHYVNWYLTGLALAWGKFIDPPDSAAARLLSKWQIENVPNQYRFYDRHVRPWLEEGENRRAFVIVSDAFRYEAAQELTAELNGKYRFTATLSSQLGVLPSYTALGMASLLPHKTLAFKGADVLVDGKSSIAAERDRILQAVGGLACKGDELMAKKKDEGREFVKDSRVVYIYHNTIDAVGDDAKTEGKTFEAVRRAIDELAALVGYIVNNLNGHHVVVTADHGFLFTETARVETDKSKLKDKPDSTIVAKKRYLLAPRLPDNAMAWHGSLSVTAGVDGDMDFWVPKGANLFHFVGGARFVHGGAMPQEIVVPLVTVKHVRGKSAQDTKTKPVTVQVLGGNHRITTAQHRFQLIQMEPVSERVKPITLKVGVCEGDEPVTDFQTLTFDSASGNLDERKKWVNLVLKDRQYSKKTAYHLVLRDVETNIEQQRVEVIIDRAFTDDF